MRKNLLQSFASLGLVQLINYVFPLITIPYVSRIIGPEGYGIINYATAFVAYFNILISYGFDYTATRRIAAEPSSLSKVFSEVMTARAYLFLVSVFLFIIALFVFSPLASNKAVAIIVFCSCISTCLTPQYVFQGMQHLNIFAFTNFLRGLLNCIFILILVKKADDLIVLPLINFFLSFGISGFLVAFAVKKFHIQFNFISTKRVWGLLIEERMMYLSSFVVSIYTTTNIIVLGFFASKADVGYYTTAQSLIFIVINVLNLPLSTVLFPYISKAFNANVEEGLNVLRSLLPVLIYVLLVVGILIFFLAPFSIHLIYGNKFDNAIAPLKILAFLPLISMVNTFLGIQTMLNLKMDKDFFRVTAMAACIGFLLNLVLSSQYGFIGTSYSYLLIELFVLGALYVTLVKKNVNILLANKFSLGAVISICKNILK
ncbi:oligosaccharide flippase family protein [Sphingobacterium sp. ML3W]|uniref:oligosaccharide flippase family protein n=1 Tax=Sphingobacterium sp. ML3W TaxID=1538644 RepID=UPI00249B4A5D|nr:oligosaccharide flippase family protein [Sphingobacterium sp. ML3W]WFA78216.1 oligosaccharide flippase family protein [Sphingobacterium sp. ML3W]